MKTTGDEPRTAEADELPRRPAGLAELCRDQAPERDLWPGIEARIQAGRARAWRMPLWAGAALAATMVMVLGLWVQHDSSRSSGRTPLQAPANFLSAGGAHERRDANLLTATGRPLHAETRALVRANLKIVNDAEVQLKRALAADPDAEYLKSLLASTRSQKVELAALEEGALMRRAFAPALLLGLVGALAARADAIDEHRPLKATGRVSVNNIAGSVVISSWDRNEVALRGETSGEVEGVILSGDADDLSIVVKLPRRSHVVGSADLQLTVPAQARVAVESVSADVIAQGLGGPLGINTVSGNVQLQFASPDIKVQTVSGDVTLRGPARSTFVKSVSGDLRLAGMQGKLAVETVSGNLELDGGRFSDVRLKSISGDLHLDVTLAEKAQVVGDTLSGNIRLDVPSDTSGTALLKSFSGDAQCNSPVANPAAGSGSGPGDDEPGQEAAEAEDFDRPGKPAMTPAVDRRREYVWGDGKGARVELSSFSGDIRVQRKPVRNAQSPPPFVGKDN